MIPGRVILWQGQFEQGKDMGKRIVVLLNTEPEWGGEHQYALTLMECLVRYDGVKLLAVCGSNFWKKWCKRHDVEISKSGWPFMTEDMKKYHLKHPVFSRLYSMYMTEFGKMLRREKVDAVICTSQAFCVPNLPVKIIAPAHDLMHRYEGRFPEVKSGYEARELVFSSLAKYAWCVLTDSKLGRQQFIESYGKYIREKRTHIVSLPFVAPKHITDCKEEYIDTPGRYIFYPAQFWLHKNHMNLVRAINILVEDIPDIYLILVGSEKNGMKRIKQYIVEHGLTDHVMVKGFVSDGNLAYLYRHAVGMVMPSYFGPTNIPPLEAMALGCPVAVSDKYGMPEQVGDAGLLFNPDSPEEIAECIRKIWTDEKLRREMARKGYRRIEKWNVEAFNRRFRKMIEKIEGGKVKK